MTKFINWLKKVFGVIGVIWSTLKNSSAGCAVIKALADTALQAKALELVTTLQSSDKSGADKEKAFNEAFNAFCDANGYAIAKSLVNCIRELALAAYNAKRQSASAD